MALKQEIELKFLVRRESLPELPPGRKLAQGYLALAPTVRVRTEVRPDGESAAYMTIKGEGHVTRDEFEYQIPFDEGTALLRLAHGAIVTKTRHELPVGTEGLKWEIDVFEGENEGLLTAEIELPSPDYPFERPEWLGSDVSHDPAYKNSRLSQRPYGRW
jgi:adenylate cyclase